MWLDFRESRMGSLPCRVWLLAGFLFLGGLPALAQPESEEESVGEPPGSEAEAQAMDASLEDGGGPGSAGELSASVPELVLGIRDCVFLALANNPNVRAQSLGVEISRTGISDVLGDFDPLFAFNYNRTKIERDTANDLQSAERENQQLDFSLNKRFLTGTSMRLAFTQTRTREFDAQFASQFGADPTQYNTDVVLSVTQPLLRGAWVHFNTSGIEVARNNEEISQNQFRALVNDTVFQVYQAYWNLVFLVATEEVQQNALELAERQLRDTSARIEVGTLARIEIHNSRASVAGRLTDVQVAQKQTEDGKDLLMRLIMPLPDLEAWNVDLEPRDKLRVLDPVEEAGRSSSDEELSEQERIDLVRDRFGVEVPKAAGWQNLAEVALDTRPEMIQARIDLENRQLAVDQAKNQKKPRVDLSGSWNLNALDSDWGPNLEDIRLSELQENRTWSLGITVEYPLGNRSLESRYRRSRLEQRQAQLQYENLARSVIAEVREAERLVRTSWQTVLSTYEAAYRSRKQLDAGNAKFENGLNTSYDVLLLQNDLSTALANQAQALTAYRIALARRELVMGTLVEYPEVGIDINVRD